MELVSLCCHKFIWYLLFWIKKETFQAPLILNGDADFTVDTLILSNVSFGQGTQGESANILTLSPLSLIPSPLFSFFSYISLYYFFYYLIYVIIQARVLNTFGNIVIPEGEIFVYEYANFTQNLTILDGYYKSFFKYVVKWECSQYFTNSSNCYLVILKWRETLIWRDILVLVVI